MPLPLSPMRPPRLPSLPPRQTGLPSRLPSLPGSSNKPISSINSLGSNNRPGAVGAVSSISRINNEDNKPLTSIAHVGNTDQRAVTSVAHIGEQHMSGTSRFEYSAEEEQAITDNLREKYILKQMKAKQAAAAAASKAPKPTKYDLDVATGKSLKMGGAGGLKRQIAKHIHEHKAAFKNISKDDREMFTDVVGGYAKKKVTNSSFTKVDRKKLRKTITEKYKGGEISKKDKMDFHKIINKLD